MNCKDCGNFWEECTCDNAATQQDQPDTTPSIKQKQCCECRSILDGKAEPGYKYYCGGCGMMMGW